MPIVLLISGSSGSATATGLSRQSIMELMGDALGLRLTGTLTSGISCGTTYAKDEARRFEQDDYLNEGYFLTRTTGISQQEMRISDWVQDTKTMNFYGSGATTALTTAHEYNVFLPPFTPDEYRAAIKSARNKMVGAGISRHGQDYTVVTDLGRRYDVSSNIDVEVTDVYFQGKEWIGNNNWISSATGWTVHANASFTNDGPGNERTLKLIATAGAEQSYVETDCSPLQSFTFFVSIKGDGTGNSRWTYNIYDEGSSAIVTAGAIATESGTSWVTYGKDIQIPSNGAELRLIWDADAASTVYTRAPNLMSQGDWVRLGANDWHVEYEGSSMVLVFDTLPPAGRRLRLEGKRTLENLSSDYETISLDEPEVGGFVELACAELWRMYGGKAPGVDIERVNTEIAKHEVEARKAINQLGDPWRVRTSLRAPRFY